VDLLEQEDQRQLCKKLSQVCHDLEDVGHLESVINLVVIKRLQSIYIPQDFRLL